MLAHNVDVAGASETLVDQDVVPFGPTQPLQLPPKGGKACLISSVALDHASDRADAPHAVALLSVSGHRPRSGRAAEQRDDVAPFPLTMHG